MDQIRQSILARARIDGYTTLVGAKVHRVRYGGDKSAAPCPPAEAIDNSLG